MKLKLDFITNSSTCAFVMFGHYVEKTEDIEKFIETYKGPLEIRDSEDDGIEEGKVFVGFMIDSVDDYDGTSECASLKDLLSYSDTIQKEFGEKFDLKKEDITLLTGIGAN